jgi:hypothetical protein
MPPPAGHSHLIGDNRAKLRLSSDFGWDSLLKNAPGHPTTRRQVGDMRYGKRCRFYRVSFSARFRLSAAEEAMWSVATADKRTLS